MKLWVRILIAVALYRLPQLFAMTNIEWVDKDVLEGFPQPSDWSDGSEIFDISRCMIHDHLYIKLPTGGMIRGFVSEVPRSNFRVSVKSSVGDIEMQVVYLRYAPQTFQLTNKERVITKIIEAIEKGDVAWVKQLMPLGSREITPETLSLGTGGEQRRLVDIAEFHRDHKKNASSRNVREQIVQYFEKILKLSIKLADTTPIFFYRENEEYGEFSNFYLAPITIGGVTYINSEHYFQAQKFTKNPTVQAQIIAEQDTKKIYDIAQKQKADDDWHSIFDKTWIAYDRSSNKWTVKKWDEVPRKVRVMLEAVRIKFTQHETLKAFLLGTGSRELIENTKDAGRHDPFWGNDLFEVGRKPYSDKFPDTNAEVNVAGRAGANLLGQILMKVRSELQAAADLEKSTPAKPVITGAAKSKKNN